MKERTSLCMEKESGIKSVAFIQGTFNYKGNWKCIKMLAIFMLKDLKTDFSRLCAEECFLQS